MREVLRQEKKYFITLFDLYAISAKLEKFMIQDKHNKGEGYRVRSLYFDTIYDEDYSEKIDGLEIRRKIRLRNYDPNKDFAILEMKQKQGDVQKKRSLYLNREDAKRLIACDYSVLQKYQEPFAAECYGLMTMKCYRPKTVVEYQRKAFIAEENSTRITFDSHIIATETCFDIFANNLAMYPVLDTFNAVLEVKFNGFLLDYMKDILSYANGSPYSVSKYCLARSASLKFSL